MTQPTKQRRDRRPFALTLTAAAVFAGGILIAQYDAIVQSLSSLRMRGHVEMQRRAGHLETIQSREIEQRFQQGVVMLHSKEYDYAAQAFHRVLELAPQMPEAHTNMGFALLGLKQWKAAHDFFIGAVELNPEQANAYYGLGVALEGLGEPRAAMGAMRTYIHRSTASEPSNYIAKARAAIWTWEEELRKGKAGPDTPPGDAAGSTQGDGEKPAE